MKFSKSTEEVLNIELFCINQSCGNIKIASSILPIQPVITKGSFKSIVSLMFKGKIVLHLNLELLFEEKAGIPFVYPTLIYPVAPPELPHVHAYELPPTFTYTPPDYYFSQHTGGYLFN